MQNLLKRELECLGYDPFGMITFGRSWEAGSGYRYGFNGMEGDDEILGNDNALDFGARVYDTRLGRWMSIDPLTKLYGSLSPYVFVDNTPIRAIDPTGKKILFINGYWNPTIIGDVFIKATEPKEGYWSASFIAEAKEYFSDYSNLGNENFIDGSGRVMDSEAEDRYTSGYEYAKANYSTLIEGMEVGETFKLISHSHGCAYSAGIAAYLIEQKQTVEVIVYLSASGPEGFTTPIEPYSVQIGYDGDFVVDESIPIEGIDRHGVVFRSDLNVTLRHGSTATSQVFKELEDLNNASIVIQEGYSTGDISNQNPTNAVDNTNVVVPPSETLYGNSNDTTFTKITINN